MCIQRLQKSTLETQADLRILEIKFRNEKDSSQVDYIKFSDEVESVFTKKGLVKAPTEEPERFEVYSNGWEADPSVNVLTEEENDILVKVMDRLHDKVKNRRIDALSYMEDYDFVQEGNQ
jgi:hypothetical protein